MMEDFEKFVKVNEILFSTKITKITFFSNPMGSLLPSKKALSDENKSKETKNFT